MSRLICGKFGAAMVTAAVLGASVSFYGCSKEQSAQTQAQTQQPSGAAENVAAAKEHFQTGMQFDMKGQNDAAIKEYEESLRLNPNSPEVHNNLGFAYFDKGDTGRAIANQTEALKLNPELANAYYGLAQALEKKGDKKGAIENWKQYIARAEPHSKYWMLAQQHVNKLEGKPMKKIKLKPAPPQPKDAK
ncbi:MAG: tetratricopeptide repeat protein [Deltaproteobacteria bacterium]|nr:tetratricopeptide repeat protein [Deltaproteobacteria bacterium]